MLTFRESVGMRLEAVLMVSNVFWFSYPHSSSLPCGDFLGFERFLCILVVVVVQLLRESTFMEDPRQSSRDVLSSP